jgi:acyl carrier protein
MDTQVTAELSHAFPKQTPDEATIQRWLVNRIAALMERRETEIDIERPFSSFALDSVAIVRLTGELQDWLRTRVPATLLSDDPSIQSLARHLATRGHA